MKILQLNVWTGRVKGSLKDFFINNTFDAVCLQEAVWSDSKLLENFCVTADQIKEFGGFKYDFRSSNWYVNAFDTKVEQGNVILSKIKIAQTDIRLICGKYGPLNTSGNKKEQGYTLQIAKLENGINLVNYHGYWLPTPLGDNNTTETMKKVSKIVKNLNTPLIMCGDLNLVHESPAMRELDFLSDLTYEYDINNTLVGLKFDGKVACDHILTSADLKVKDFRVLDDLISDHKALMAEINV